MSTQTTLQITEEVTDVTATGDTLSVSITDDVTEVQAYTLAIPINSPGQLSASAVTVQPYGSITAQFLQDALEQLADNDTFKQASAPTGAQVGEGDIWYDTDDEQFKVYRETSTDTFQWVPIIVGAAAGDSDTIDAGSY